VSLADEARPPSKAGENPLRLELSGLPHQTSPYGTGAPSYIEDRIARSAIEKIFAEEGIALEKRYTYDNDGVAFVADGYNPKLKIGYFFGSWQTLDQDAIISWMTRAEKEGGPPTQEELKRKLEWMGYSADAELKAEIGKAAGIQDEGQLRQAYDALARKSGKSKLSLAEAQALEKRAEQGKEFIAVISQFDSRFITSRWGRVSSEEEAAEMKRIESLKTPKEKKDAWRTLKEKAAVRSVEALEKAVRQYIQWARAQGLQ